LSGGILPVTAQPVNAVAALLGTRLATRDYRNATELFTLLPEKFDVFKSMRLFP
jgi:hypothetical protein